MKNVTQVHVKKNQITETIEALRHFGRNQNEGFVLWLGNEEDNTAKIEKVLVPPQKPIRSEYGVGYFITEETLYALNKYLREHNLRLIAQVHSHPGRAYHSDTDDKYAIVTKEGGFSLVVPDFGFGASELEAWAIYRLKGAKWKSLSRRKTRKIFTIEN